MLSAAFSELRMGWVLEEKEVDCEKLVAEKRSNNKIRSVRIFMFLPDF